MKVQASTNTEKRLTSLEERVQRLVEHVNKKFTKVETEKDKSTGFVCRYCGKQVKKPTPGTCPYSPNKQHSFIKA